MVEIRIDISKSIYETINDYFEKSKKFKKKYLALLERIKETENKLKEAELSVERERQKIKKKLNRKWYDKFRWFFTSEDFLVIAGKDAITNEILIRKYLSKDDLVFHADIHGSPFGIIKTEGKKVGEISLQEAAQFVASYSKAWKQGLSSVEVYWVYPDQVSKKSPAGEYLPKGSFMIYGNKNYVRVKLEVAIGVDDEGMIVHGVPSSVSKITNNYVVLVPGNIRVSDVAKRIAKLLNTDDIEEIQRWIPGESFILSKRKRKL